MEWIFLDLAGVNFVKLSISLGEKYVFLPFKWEISVNNTKRFFPFPLFHKIVN